MTDSDLERTKRQKDRAFEKEARRLAYESREHARLSYLSDLKAAELKGRLEGKIEGRREGERRGDLKALNRCAQAAIKQNLPTELIVTLTGLSPESIDQLRKQ